MCSTVSTKFIYIPVDIAKSDIANRKRGVIVTLAVAHFLVVTIVSRDDNGVVDVVQIDVLELDLLHATLPAGPCLDSKIEISCLS